jgi:hypothetical protein
VIFFENMKALHKDSVFNREPSAAYTKPLSIRNSFVENISLHANYKLAVFFFFAI